MRTGTIVDIHAKKNIVHSLRCAVSSWIGMKTERDTIKTFNVNVQRQLRNIEMKVKLRRIVRKILNEKYVPTKLLNNNQHCFNS
jgi:hypothetical protein